MKQIQVSGKQVRYWDFTAVADPDAPGVKGSFVKQPVEVSFSAPENSDEVFQSCGNSEERLVELVVKGLAAEASDKAGQIPAECWSPAMCSAACRGLKAKPEFVNLKHSELRNAVMRYVGTTPALKDALGAAFNELRSAQEADEE